MKEFFLRSEIKKNKKIYDVLWGCSDELLLKNQSIILAALDLGEVKDGYDINFFLKDDQLFWEYVPNNDQTKFFKKIIDVKKNYVYKLENNLQKMYSTNLNDVSWTINKKQLAVEFKKIMKKIEDKNILIKGLWLYGKSGNGKTYALIALLNSLSIIGLKVAFVNIQDLALKIQNSFNNTNLNSESDYLNTIKNSDVVVIDDIGSERPTIWLKENVLLPLINFRSQTEKLTFFTSNLDIIKYEKRLKIRSENIESENETNIKIISRIKSLIHKEVEI